MRPGVRLAALPLLLLLPACGSAPPPPPEVRLVRPEVPAALLACRPAPAVPPVDADDTAIAGYILDLEEAGADCRDRLQRMGSVLAVPW